MVIGYLWGTSARTIIVAIAKAIEDAHPVRFIQVGEASRGLVELPAAALCSSAIQIMGSGLKSVPFPKLLDAIRETLALASQGELNLPTEAVPLSTVASRWNAPGKPRLVYTLTQLGPAETVCLSVQSARRSSHDRPARMSTEYRSVGSHPAGTVRHGIVRRWNYGD